MVFRKSVSLDPKEEAYVRRVRRQPIFNSKRNDFKRKQGRLDSKKIPGLLSQVRGLCESNWPSLRVSDAVALESLRGCKEQAPHSDYDPEALRSLEGSEGTEVPRGLVVALDEGETRLEVWPGSHLPRGGRGIRKKTLRLSKGDAVAFRGDLVHAGSSYPSGPNFRAHFYLDHDQCPRSPNRTYRVQPGDGRVFPAA